MKGQEWRTPQTASMVFSNTIAFFNDVFFSYYVYYQTILPLNIIEGLSLLMLLISLFLPLYFYFIGKNDSVFIVSLFFTVPFVTAVLVSINNSILLSRYLSILIPYLIASFIGFIICVRFSIVRILFSSFLIFVSLTGMIFNYSYDFKNNDYRELTSYLNSNAQDDELISVEPHYMGWHILHYAKTNNVKFSEPVTLGWDINMMIDSIRIKKDIQKIWIVLDYSSLDTNRYSSLRSEMKNIGFELKDYRIFKQIPAKVELFKFER
jgi:hypothetical protein